MREKLLAHEVHGDGPKATLLLHGLLGSRRNLRGLARSWAAAEPGRRVIVADLTGHGASRPLPPRATLFDMARDVLRLAEALGAPPFEIVGHSLGGRVALAALCLRGPLSSLTMLDIGPGAVSEGLGEDVMNELVEAPDRFSTRKEARDHLVGRGIARPVANWLTLNLARAGDGGWLSWRVDRAAIAGLYHRQSREDLWRCVEAASGETKLTCVLGERSGYVGEAEARRMQRAGVIVRSLAGAGHFVHMDAKERLLELLTGKAEARHE